MVIKHKNTTSNKFWLYCVDKKVCIFMLQSAVLHVQYLYSKGEAILIVQKRNSLTGFTLLDNSLSSKLILEVVFESEFSKDIMYLCPKYWKSFVKSCCLYVPKKLC